MVHFCRSSRLALDQPRIARAGYKTRIGNVGCGENKTESPQGRIVQKRSNAAVFHLQAGVRFRPYGNASDLRANGRFESESRHWHKTTGGNIEWHNTSISSLYRAFGKPRRRHEGVSGCFVGIQAQHRRPERHCRSDGQSVIPSISWSRSPEATTRSDRIETPHSDPGVSHLNQVFGLYRLVRRHRNAVEEGAVGTVEVAQGQLPCGRCDGKPRVLA